MTSIRFLAPVLALSAFAFALFGVNTVPEFNKRATSFWLALVGLVAAALSLPCIGVETLSYGRGMLLADPLSFVLTWIVLVAGLFVVLLSEKEKSMEGMSLAVYYGLLLLSVAGLALVVSSNDFLMIFLAIELVGIPGFILSGYLRNVGKSSEAAIKFFLIGAFSSAMLAYGISILYGITGSTSLLSLQTGAQLLHDKPALALLGIFFILVSFGFKIALVPFHMWVPDTFEGAPTPVAAFLSVAPKIAGVAIALRVFSFNLPGDFGVARVLAILAVLTMTIGNVIGLQQTNVVRLLAYSSIVHMGYMLIGLVAGGTMGVASVYLYGWVYLFMNMGAFAVVICLSNALQSNDISAYAGLAKRSPLISALFFLFLISLAGLPPTAGFIAKFYVFSAAYQQGWIWLVVAAAVNSVISVGYYFKILHTMYFKDAVSDEPIPMNLPTRLTLAVASFATLFLGIAPQSALVKTSTLANRPAAIEQPAEPPAVHP